MPERSDLEGAGEKIVKDGMSKLLANLNVSESIRGDLVSRLMSYGYLSYMNFQP